MVHLALRSQLLLRLFLHANAQRHRVLPVGTIKRGRRRKRTLSVMRSLRSGGKRERNAFIGGEWFHREGHRSSVCDGNVRVADRTPQMTENGGVCVTLTSIQHAVTRVADAAVNKRWVAPTNEKRALIAEKGVPRHCVRHTVLVHCQPTRRAPHKRGVMITGGLRQTTGLTTRRRTRQRKNHAIPDQL